MSKQKQSSLRLHATLEFYLENVNWSDFIDVNATTEGELIEKFSLKLKKIFKEVKKFARGD